MQCSKRRPAATDKSGDRSPDSKEKRLLERELLLNSERFNLLQGQIFKGICESAADVSRCHGILPEVEGVHKGDTQAG